MQNDTELSHNLVIDTELVVTGIVYGLTFAVGLIGNILIIYSVVHFRRMKSLSNIFLASLATADLILIIFCVPVKFAQLFSFTWTFGTFLCKSVHYIQILTAICSVYTLTAMSIERYYAIIHPMKCRYICTMSQTKRTIVAIWIGSFILAMPVIWIQIMHPVGTSKNNFWCIRNWSSQFYWAYELYMLTIILIIPLIIMCYSYAHICYKLRSVMNDRTSDFPLATAQPTVYIDASARKMSQVIKMLITVVVIFVLCWTPILVLGVLQGFSIIQPLNYGVLKYVKSAFLLSSYANSCVNPIIYGFMSRNFRTSFRAALAKCLGYEKSEKDLMQMM